MDPFLWIARKVGLVHRTAKNPDIERRTQEVERAVDESRERLDAIQRSYEAKTDASQRRSPRRA